MFLGILLTHAALYGMAVQQGMHTWTEFGVHFSAIGVFIGLAALARFCIVRKRFVGAGLIVVLMLVLDWGTTSLFEVRERPLIQIDQSWFEVALMVVLLVGLTDAFSDTRSSTMPSFWKTRPG